jgi:hypothetical protein
MRPRIPEVARLPVTFKAMKDHVVVIFHINQSSIGLRFESPEHMLTFFTEMMEKAAIAWPDNEWIKEYLSDEG